MITNTTKIHYKDLQGNAKSSEAMTHHLSPGSDGLDNEICLINTCGEFTNFEEMPAAIERWANQIRFDGPCFPNLTRLWGFGRSEYAFTFHYELSNENDSVPNREYPLVLGYYAQLNLIMAAAEELARAIPYALVRLHETAAFEEQHDLEIVLPYPCEPEKIHAVGNLLQTQFDYIWDLGKEPREQGETSSSLCGQEATQKAEFEYQLPDGTSFFVEAGGDKNYPGVYIKLRQPNGIDALVCFAEFNSDKPDGKNICVGAYAANCDDPTYYASYHDDGLPCGVI